MRPACRLRVAGGAGPAGADGSRRKEAEAALGAPKGRGGGLRVASRAPRGAKLPRRRWAGSVNLRAGQVRLRVGGCLGWMHAMERKKARVPPRTCVHVDLGTGIGGSFSFFFSFEV